MLPIYIPRLNIKTKPIAPIASIRNIGASTQSPTIFRPRRKGWRNSSTTLIKELKHFRTDSPTIKANQRNPGMQKLNCNCNLRRARTKERGEQQSRSKKSLNVMCHTANVFMDLKAPYSNTSSSSTLNAFIANPRKNTIRTPEISLICLNTDQFLYQRPYHFNQQTD